MGAFQQEKHRSEKPVDERVRDFRTVNTNQIPKKLCQTAASVTPNGYVILSFALILPFLL